MSRAFTIIELSIVLVVIAVLSAIVLPRATGFIDSIEVRGAVTELESLFSTARHVAIARGVQSSLEIDPARGIIAVRAGTDTIAKREILEAHGVSIQSTRASITYAPTGFGYGAGNMTIVLRRNRTTDSIFVSRLGRVRH
jgi:prepilin-type N-terminal cleavage/methylation domain-containing protein